MFDVNKKKSSTRPRLLTPGDLVKLYGRRISSPLWSTPAVARMLSDIPSQISVAAIPRGWLHENDVALVISVEHCVDPHDCTVFIMSSRDNNVLFGWVWVGHLSDSCVESREQHA